MRLVVRSRCVVRSGYVTMWIDVVVQSTTLYYKVRPPATPYYKVLLRTAEYYNVLPRTTKYYSVLLTYLGGLLTLPLMWATRCGTLTMFGFLGAQRAGPKFSIWSLIWLVKPIPTAFCQGNQLSGHSACQCGQRRWLEGGDQNLAHNGRRPG